MTAPFYRELGIDVELAALVGAREIENGLRGAETAITDDGWAAYRETTTGLLDGWDVVLLTYCLLAGVAPVRWTERSNLPSPS